METLSRLVQPAGIVLAVLAVTVADGSWHEASAQGRVEARFLATLSGLTVGKGAWVVDVRESEFTAVASGSTAGLLSFFAKGEGTSAARGKISDGRFVSTVYASTITTPSMRDEVRIVLGDDAVREFDVSPLPKPNPRRVPVKAAHRRGVSDPMTASLMHVPGSGAMLAPESCKRTIPVFDGRMRYDLKLRFKRFDVANADRGYRGTALVCGVDFDPIAGFVPNRAAIGYLTRQRDMEVSLVPIAGTRLLAPFRFKVPTPLGTGIVQATRFVSEARKPRGTRAGMNQAR